MATIDDIIAGIAGNRIATTPATQIIVARTTDERVIAFPADQQIGASQAMKRIIAKPAINGIEPAVPEMASAASEVAIAIAMMSV